MITVQKLTKKFGERTAVDEISFEVNQGEVLGFLGQNGAGKTTTMKILTCFMPATSGTVKIAGFDVFDDPFEVKKRIGYLPENPPLYYELLVDEYLRFVAQLRGLEGKQLKSRIEYVLKKLNILDVRYRLIANLSKGYRQRVGLAQALVHDPQVLIMDEPTIGLDPKQISEARELIRSFKNERTVIYSTHILSEVAATCDRIIIINHGKFMASESLAQFTDQTSKTEIRLKHLDEAVISDLRNIPGVKSIEAIKEPSPRILVDSEGGEDVIAEMAKRVVERNVGLLGIMPAQLALEQHYLDVIGARRG